MRSQFHKKSARRRIGVMLSGFACGMTVAAMLSIWPATPSYAAAAAVFSPF